MCFGFLANTIYFRSWAISFARSLTSPPASPPILPEKRARLRNVYLNVFPRLLEKKCLTCKCLTRQRCSSWRRFLTQVEVSDFEFECHTYKGTFSQLLPVSATSADELVFCHLVSKQYSNSKSIVHLYPLSDKGQSREQQGRERPRWRREGGERRRRKRAREPLEELRLQLLENKTEISTM